MAPAQKMKQELSQQDKEHSRKVRQEIAKLGKDIQENREDYLSLSNDTLRQKMIELNAHSEKVQRAPDQALESQIFLNLMTISTDKMLRFCASNSAVAPGDLAKALFCKFGRARQDDVDVDPKDFNWVKFGDSIATALFRSVGCAQVDFMMGSVKPPPVRKQAARAPRQKPAAAGAVSQPDELDASTRDESNETAKLTEEMFARIQRHGRQPFCFLVLNHESFAQTVENMFSVSMLVGSAKVTLQCDPEWGMSVELATLERQQSTGHVPKRRESNFAQMVVNMNFGVWEEMKRKCKPEQCLTPNRDAIAEAGAPQRRRGADEGDRGGHAAKKARRT